MKSSWKTLAEDIVKIRPDLDVDTIAAKLIEEARHVHGPQAVEAFTAGVLQGVRLVKRAQEDLRGPSAPR